MSQWHSNSTGFVNASLCATANIAGWGSPTSEIIRILIQVLSIHLAEAAVTAFHLLLCLPLLK